MNTHLSEASVNSLLSLVKGANTSGSYDDKINILTKAGVLHGGQTYSSRAKAPAAPAPAGPVAAPAAEAPESAASVEVVAGAGAAYIWGINQQDEMARLAAQLQTFEAIAKRHKERYPDDFSPSRFGPRWYDLILGKRVEPDFFDRTRTTAVVLDRQVSPTATDFADFLDNLVDKGFLKELRALSAYTKDPNAVPAIVAELLLLFALFLDLFLITVETLINEGPAYLSTIPDGTYSFTVNQANTTQPVILTGTAVITSQYDRYTKRLEQKLINNTIVGAVPITALQTLDASYNSIQVDTSGSSYNGKYTVTGNTGTITSNGYSKAAGAFVETVTTIISSIFSVYVINNIINPDKSQTTISLTIYTRQLTSAEIQKTIDDAFTVADTDSDGLLRPGEALLAAYRLAGSLGGRVFFDPEPIKGSGVPISKEVFGSVLKEVIQPKKP